MLVILALVCQVLADGAAVHGLAPFGAQTAIPWMASLAFGAVALGVGLLAA